MERIMERLRAVLSMPIALVILLLLSLMLLSRGQVNGNMAQERLERRVEQALSQIEGAGCVQVIIRTHAVSEKANGSGLITRSEGERIPCGAIAIAQGAGDPVVNMRITSALCALLGLQASQVDVLVASGGIE